MSHKKTFIEINGKQYDAHTGHLLDLAPPARQVHSESALPDRSSIEGVARRPGDIAMALNRVKYTTHKAAPRMPKHATTSLQKSKTLMRPAVQKPLLKSIPTPSAKVTEKPALAIGHPAREARAKAIDRSSAISRFHHGLHAHESHQQKTDTRPDHQQNVHTEKHGLLGTLEAQLPTLSDMDRRLQQAVKDASSHLQQLPRRKRRLRPVQLASSAVVIVLLGGFFAFQNMPNLQMRIAANKAGFAAGLPSYRPAGFDISGPIQTEPGKVVINFRSKADERSFTIKQQASEWNSYALLHNRIGNNTSDLRTFEAQGKTVYVYGESNATWVDGGVWYEIAGDARLNEDQLQRIAASL